MSEKPVKSLGRWYDANLKDKDQVDQLRQDIIHGLESIDKSLLPGRLKHWCLQFGLLPRLTWPLTIYEAPISKVEELGRLISSFAKKWLGLPRCLSKMADIRHDDIVVFGESRPSWHKAAPSQRRDLVVEEVNRQEQATRCAKAVSQAKQGKWMR